VRLLTDRASVLEYQETGTLIDVSDVEAGRLIAAGQAESVSENETEAAEAAPFHKRNSQKRGRRYVSPE
jgi:hypothetical protein